MQTIVLDYSDGKVYFIHHQRNYPIEKMEKLLSEKFDFCIDEIEWMIVKNLEIETLKI